MNSGRNGHLITHREKKPFECRADGCGKSYCDARSLRRHQDNHHALSTSHLIGQPSSPSTAVVASRSSSASSNAGLIMNELSGGSPELLIPLPSNGSTYPAPNSNSSSTNSNHHFTVNQTASGMNEHQQQPFAGWDSTVQLESCIQYGSAGANGFLTGPPSSTDHSESHSWVSVPAASVTTKDVKKSTANGTSGIHNNKLNSNNNHPPTVKTVAATTPTLAVKSGNKKSKSTKVQNGKTGNGNKTNANKKTTSDSGVATNNDGLTTQQLELIQEIMRQTQEQHRLMQEEQQQHMQQQHKPAHPSGPASTTTTTTTTSTSSTATTTSSSSSSSSSTSSSSSGSSKIKKSNAKVKWTAAASSSVSHDSSQPATDGTTANGTAANGAAAGRPVECNVCQRRFKNTPALNGHMRLHGGFLKKDAECNGSNGSFNNANSGSNTGGGSGGGVGSGNGTGGGSGGNGGSGKKPGENKKDPSNPPLLTASVSVRALIEEKIIQRRNNLAASNHSSNGGAGTSSSSPSSTTTTTSTPSSTPNSSAVAVVQPDQPQTLSISIQPVNPPDVSVMMMDVLDDEQQDSSQVQSQPSLIPKLEPEGYFEGIYRYAAILVHII